MTATVQTELFTHDLQNEIEPLVHQHWHEIANWRERIPLDVYWQAYRDFQSNDRLLVLTARDSDEYLVGYSVFFMLHTCHYHSSLFAMNDVIWLHPEYRKSGLGMRLITESERLARERGAVKISWHTKPGNELHKVFERLGYIVEDINLGKLL